MTESWTCTVCGVKWPAYNLVEAFRKREIAHEKHPDKECWEVTDVKGYELGRRRND